MTKYTEEVEKIFKTIESPYPNFIVDLIEYPGHIALRVYKPNIDKFKQAEKVALATYLYQLRDAIRNVTGCEIEGVIDEPPAKERVSAARDSLLRRRESLGSGASQGRIFLPGEV